MKKALLLITAIFLTSCVTLPERQKLSPAVYYRQDICFTYETGQMKEEKVRNFFKRFRKGKYRKKRLVRETAKFCGVGVLPFLEKYNIEVQAQGNLNFFSLTTCHEETTSENPDSGWFKKKGKVGFTYEPTMERGKACPLYVSAYDKRQRHGWGIIAFENPRYELPAKLSCNGYVEEYNGVSICQSREKLLQKIEFGEPVKLVAPVNGAAERKQPCPVIGKDNDKTIEFLLPNRECVYGFIGKKTGKVHQLITVGYEDIIIRE